MSGLLISAMVLALVAQAARCTTVPTIQAPWGRVQGVVVKGDEGREMNGYLGIPYAQPPVGDLRFEKPRPHAGPGAGQVFVADQVMPACPQLPLMVGSTREMSEDCLKLDVYLPVGADNSASPLAVMVFIHGGGFFMGDASFYRPSKLVVDGNVIVVAIQYRLGTLGFLYTGDDVVPGNNGLWDQTLALRWVKDNIQAFGGDSDSITIFGESAGSMSVGLHLISPQSKGLFKRVIMESGSPQDIQQMAGTFDRKAVFKGLVDLFDCQGSKTEELVQCLKQQPDAEFFNKSVAYGLTSPTMTYFNPVEDGEFIPKNLKELLQDEQYMKDSGIGDIDIMSGLDDKEGSVVLFLLQLQQLPPEAMYSADFFSNVMRQCLVVNGYNVENQVLMKSIEFFYRGAGAGTTEPVSMDAVVDMYGDCILIAPVLDFTRILAANPRSGANYLYVVNHDFSFNKDSPIPGSHHGDELMLLFDNEIDLPDDSIIKAMKKTDITPEEKPLATKFAKIFTTFAKTGNPNPVMRDDLGGDWPQFTTENKAYLSFSNTPHVVEDVGPYKNRMALWRYLLPELNALTQSAKEAQGEQPKAREEL